MSGLRFEPPAYEGGRRLLMCGAVQVGAVFPPCGNPPNKWAWRVWVTASGHTADGQAKSEEAAKAAARTEFRKFLSSAGLEVKHDG